MRQFNLSCELEDIGCSSALLASVQIQSKMLDLSVDENLFECLTLCKLQPYFKIEFSFTEESPSYQVVLKYSFFNSSTYNNICVSVVMEISREVNPSKDFFQVSISSAAYLLYCSVASIFLQPHNERETAEHTIKWHPVMGICTLSKDPTNITNCHSDNMKSPSWVICIQIIQL